MIIVGRNGRLLADSAPVKGPANYLSLLVNRARMEGIVVFDCGRPLTPKARRKWHSG